LTAVLLVLVREVGLGSTDDSGKLALVLTLNFLEGNNGGGLFMDHGTQARFPLHDDVRYAHLAAQSGKEDNKLDGVDIVGNDNEGGFLGFDQGNNVVKTVFDEQGFLGVLVILLLALGGGRGGSLKAGLLLLLGLRAVLVEEFEQLNGSVLVQGVRELGNGGGNLRRWWRITFWR